MSSTLSVCNPRSFLLSSLGFLLDRIYPIDDGRLAT